MDWNWDDDLLDVPVDIAELVTLLEVMLHSRGETRSFYVDTIAHLNKLTNDGPTLCGETHNMFLVLNVLSNLLDKPCKCL